MLARCRKNRIFIFFEGLFGGSAKKRVKSEVLVINQQKSDKKSDQKSDQKPDQSILNGGSQLIRH